MSDAIEHDQIEEGASATPPDDTEARARRMGWKPAEELRVAPRNGTLTAAEFLERGENDLPILRERLRSQDGQLIKMSKDLESATTVITDCPTSSAPSRRVPTLAHGRIWRKSATQRSRRPTSARSSGSMRKCAISTRRRQLLSLPVTRRPALPRLSTLMPRPG